jgi:hypothetical protein
MAEYPFPPQSVPYNVPPNTEVPRKLLDPNFVSWATSKGYSVNPYPSASWYQQWGPFIYMFEIQGVGLEVECDFGEADLWLAEAYESGDIDYEKTGKVKHDGKDMHVVAFITSPHLKARGAVRSRLGGGVKDDIGRTLGSLFSRTPDHSALGDDRLEALFEVAVPTKEEGNAALPPALRQYLLQHQWKGVLELRAGGMVCTMHERKGFDASNLEATITILGDLYRAAITPPG